jgi:hypothetical protein
VSELINALLSKLQAIDRACEESALPKIMALHLQTRFEAGRFHMPSFQDASQIWLVLIKEKESRITNELELIFSSVAYIGETELTALANCMVEIFSESKYLNRLTLFKDGVVRCAQSYGLSSIETRLGNNATDAAYRACVMNSIRAALANIEANTKLFISNRSVKMGFTSLMTDKVTVIKQSGEQHEGIAASVQTGKIFLQRADILIEPGDIITRSMSNGGQETFEVIDPGFHEQFHGIPASYQMRVQKLGVREAKAAIQHVTYNITGDNARFNNNTIDNSINITNNTSALEKIYELRQAIEVSIPHDQKEGALEIVDVIESQFKNGTPSKSVVSALLAGVPQAANIATIISAILGLL